METLTRLLSNHVYFRQHGERPDDFTASDWAPEGLLAEIDAWLQTHPDFGSAENIVELVAEAVGPWAWHISALIPEAERSQAGLLLRNLVEITVSIACQLVKEASDGTHEA